MFAPAVDRPTSARLNRDGVVLVSLFVVAFALRWLFSDGDFSGDDAWYFYLARTLGLEPAVRFEQPWFHILNRPLFYLLFHFATYGGLVCFRLLACGIGACVPVLCFRTSRLLGASFGSALVMAAALCLQRQHLEHAAYGFPDLLAAAFALLACAAAAQGQARATLWLSLGCVLCKESFVFVPLIATWIRLSSSGALARPDRWAWWTLLLPAAYVIAVTLLGAMVPGVPMQGWSQQGLTLRHARNMWVGPELWPFIVWLAARRRVRILVLWLGMPVFYLLWSRLLGRGIAPWYVIGPASLSAVAASLLLDELRSELASRRWPGRLPEAVLVVACLCLAPVPLLGLMRVRAQVVKLAGRFPWPSAAPAVLPLLAQAQPEHLLLIDCFWAFRYSHLRGRSAPAQALWYTGPADTERVVAAALAADMSIVCRHTGQEPLERALLQQKLTVLLRDERWLIARRVR